MEPPVIPLSPRSRLTRDYVSDEIPSRVSSRATGRDYETYRSYGFQRPGSSGKQSEDSIVTARHLPPNQHGNIDARSMSSQASDIPYRDGTSEQIHSPQEELRKLDFNLDPIDEVNSVIPSHAPSVSSVSRLSQTTGVSGSTRSKLPDFFAPEIIQVVLHNPTTSHQLLKFSKSRLCGETMQFLEKADRYNNLLNDVARTLFEIHHEFITSESSNQVGINDHLLVKTDKDVKSALATTLPKLEAVFVDAQNDAERIVSDDIYPRFVRHQMTMSAVKALASNRDKYAGLGDCFVLTDPTKADNPIVYASDGFVKVTGYSRNEIIPRNCRFLQCRKTDRTAVSRIRQAINKREESVELILNQKKNGEPFWNLLYTSMIIPQSRIEKRLTIVQRHC